MAKAVSLPMVAGAVVLGIVTGNVIFGPPLEKYWAEKLREEAASKDSPPNNTTNADDKTSSN